MGMLKENRMTKSLRILWLIIALILAIGAVFALGATAYAEENTAKSEVISTETAKPAESVESAKLTVKEVWLTGDILHLSVTDDKTSENQTLELNLSDYAKPADEYVTIQATDSGGRTSNAVSFKNPYFSKDSKTESTNAESKSESKETDSKADSKSETKSTTKDSETTKKETDKTSKSSIPKAENPDKKGNPLTPDGTGTVLDNVSNGDGKEFFTVETPDGNVFYLIVDRQRDSENVYLLNAVNEDDLASLAKSGNGKGTSAVQTPVVG